MSNPRISYIQPKEYEEQRGAVVVLRGEDFGVGSVVSIDGGAPIVPTNISSGGDELRFLLPSNLLQGTRQVRVTNTDGGISNFFPLELLGTKSVVNGYHSKIVDPRIQPLPIPFERRTDPQRVIAGNQFNGKLPNAEQGRFGDVVGPTSGGFWLYNDDIVIVQVDFTAAAEEAAPGRAIGSGLYIVRKNGAKQFMLSVGGRAAQGKEGELKDLSLRNDPLYVDQGETILFETADATEEMQVTLTVQRRKPESFS